MNNPTENWHVIRQEMAKDGEVKVVHLDDQYRAQHYLFIAQRKPDAGLFDPRELEILDQQVQRFQNFSAAGIGEYTRQELAWISTENGEYMEYLIHGMVGGPMSVNSIKHARKISAAVAQRRQQKTTATFSNQQRLPKHQRQHDPAADHSHRHQRYGPQGIGTGDTIVLDHKADQSTGRAVIKVRGTRVAVEKQSASIAHTRIITRNPRHRTRWAMPSQQAHHDPDAVTLAAIATA